MFLTYFFKVFFIFMIILSHKVNAENNVHDQLGESAGVCGRITTEESLYSILIPHQYNPSPITYFVSPKEETPTNNWLPRRRYKETYCAGEIKNVRFSYHWPTLTADHANIDVYLDLMQHIPFTNSITTGEINYCYLVNYLVGTKGRRLNSEEMCKRLLPLSDEGRNEKGTYDPTLGLYKYINDSWTYKDRPPPVHYWSMDEDNTITTVIDCYTHKNIGISEPYTVICQHFTRNFDFNAYSELRFQYRGEYLVNWQAIQQNSIQLLHQFSIKGPVDGATIITNEVVDCYWTKLRCTPVPTDEAYIKVATDKLKKEIKQISRENLKLGSVEYQVISVKNQSIWHGNHFYSEMLHEDARKNGKYVMVNFFHKSCNAHYSYCQSYASRGRIEVFVSHTLDNAILTYGTHDEFRLVPPLGP